MVIPPLAGVCRVGAGPRPEAEMNSATTISHCEADFVSRSNLVEGQGIAAHLPCALNDIRGFSPVLHDPEGSHYRIWR